MRRATRAGIHIDPHAEFIFVADPREVPADATPFYLRGLALGHVGGNCSFETILRSYESTDPVLWRIPEIVHLADLDDDRFDAPRRPVRTSCSAGCR